MIRAVEDGGLGGTGLDICGMESPPSQSELGATSSRWRRRATNGSLEAPYRATEALCAKWARYPSGYDGWARGGE